MLILNPFFLIGWLILDVVLLYCLVEKKENVVAVVDDDDGLGVVVVLWCYGVVVLMNGMDGMDNVIIRFGAKRKDTLFREGEGRGRKR